MSRDKALGLGLASISLLLAAGTGIYFAATDGSVPLAIFAWPALGFIAGIAITFFGFIEAGLNIDDEIEQFPQLVQDDIHDLRSGRISFAHIFVALTLLAAAVEIGLLFWFRKQEASWGPINVLLVTLVVVATTLVLSLRANWFQQRRYRLTPYIYAIPAIGWLICISIGVSYAEPIEYGGPTPLERSQATRTESYSSSPAPVRSYFIFETAGDALTGIDCDDEACLVVLLIAVVVIAVLASATIPHFWVVATLMLLTLMAAITIRELLYRDDIGESIPL